MEAKNSDSKSQDPICQLPEFEKSTFKQYLNSIFRAQKPIHIQRKYTMNTCKYGKSQFVSEKFQKDTKRWQVFCRDVFKERF